MRKLLCLIGLHRWSAWKTVCCEREGWAWWVRDCLYCDETQSEPVN